MNAFKKIVALLSIALISSAAAAITNNQVFAFAEANYPGLFAGAASTGQYMQYNYRYYPATGNYLAVDDLGVIHLLGPSTGNAIQRVGPVADYASAITAWESAQGAAGAADYSGTWSGSYFGMTLTYVITQQGNNLTLKSVPTLLTAEQTYTGTISGNAATISTTDYATSTSTLTAIDSRTVRVVQNSCVASQANAIYCLVPNGTAITFTRQ